MFHEDDYGFDPLEDYIDPVDSESLKKDLKNIIDRFYHGDSIDESDIEEMDVSIRRMAAILSVGIPKKKVKHPAYVEELLELNLYSIEHIYKWFDSTDAYSYLITSLKKHLEDFLTEDDIKDFCYSEFYKKKHEEAKYVH